jgi:hypothetical protein
MIQLLVVLTMLLLTVRGLGAQGQPDLFRFARQRECTVLPANGLRGLIEAAATPQTVLPWPVLAPAQGLAAITNVLDAQPHLDLTEFRCQPFRVAQAADGSYGVVVYLVQARRTVPDTLHQLGRMLAAWRRGEGRWTLDMIAPIHLVDVNRLGVPDALPTVTPTRPNHLAAQGLWEADSMLARVAADSGLDVALASRLVPEAVALPTNGELQIGPTEITAPLRAILRQALWRPLHAGASDDGSVGWTVGSMEVTRAPPGRPASTLRATYAALWVRRDGAWRIFALGFTPRGTAEDLIEAKRRAQQ